MFSYLFDFIAPKKCIFCKKYGSFFCEDCVKKIYRQEPYCYICKNPSEKFFIHNNCRKQRHQFENISQIFVLGHYNGSILKKAIHEAKFYHKREVFVTLWNLLSQMIKEQLPKIGDDYIVISPPMHFLRKWSRGYNHSEILSKTLAKELGIPDVSSAIKKRKNTKQQSRLTKDKRLDNLHGVYACLEEKKHLLKGKKCILVDDVISTGATVSEISKVLLENGVKEVKVVVIASH